MKVSTEIKWTKSVWAMKGMLERNAYDGAKSFCLKFAEIAREFINKKVEFDASHEEKKEKIMPKISLKKALPKKKKVLKITQESTSQSRLSSLTDGVITPTNIISSANNTIQNLEQIPKMAWHRISFTTLFLVGFIFLLLLFFSMLALNFRLLSLERQLQHHKASNVEMDSKLSFLHTFVEVLSNNITGVKGDLSQQWHYWKENTKLLDKQLNNWQQQLQQLSEEISMSKIYLDKVAAGDLMNTKQHHPNREEDSLWLLLLLFCFVLTVIMFVYYYYFNKHV